MSGKMNFAGEREQVISALLERLKSLPAGTSKSTAELFRERFPDAPEPEFSDFGDLHYALPGQAEKAGLYLDDTHHFDRVEGVPFNLDFIVKPLKPVVSFDVVRYSESSWPGLPEELTIDLRKKAIVYVSSDSADRDHPAIRKCTAAEWDEIAVLAVGCRFDQWEESYVKPVLDGTSWKIDLQKDGKVVKESSGRNGYPNCWRMFTALKEYCGKTVSERAEGGAHA